MVVGGSDPVLMVSTHSLPPIFHYLVTLLNKHRVEAAQPWYLTLHIDATEEMTEFNYDFNINDILKAFRWLRHVGDVKITGLHGLSSAQVDGWINDIKYGDKDRPNLDLIFDALKTGLFDLQDDSSPYSHQQISVDELEREVSAEGEVKPDFELDSNLEGLPCWSLPLMMRLKEAADREDEEMFFLLRRNVLIRADRRVLQLHRTLLDYA